MSGIHWEDAEQLAIQYPETFTRPGPKRLAALREGDLAKVCTCNERFWCEITAREGVHFTARVDNELQHTAEHGISLDDIVQFEERHIYQALLKQENTSEPTYR
ncbi:MAG: hypothetical protein FJX23_05720 [Alphaproteobacteria bacterium]|nr:hypothetical protein [Alphaproteobacteria bacterium]